MNKIRPIALAILRHPDGRLLLEKGHDRVKGLDFYRPLGGGIEFGETGAQALAREFREELGAEVRVEKLLGTVENIFEYQGAPGHEIILFYACSFIDAKYDAQEHLTRHDGKPGHTYWKTPEEIEAEKAKLFPANIVVLMEG